MKCHECGAENPPTSKFCSTCGAALKASTPSGSGGLTPLDTNVEHVQREYAGSRGRISYRIDGTTLQVVTIELEPGEVLYSESGGMSWMTANIELKTHSGGGLGKMFKRALSGESLFITDFYTTQGRGTVAFSCEFPGKIIPFDLKPGESLIVQKDAFMCAEKSVDLDLHFPSGWAPGCLAAKALSCNGSPGRAWPSWRWMVRSSSTIYSRAST